MESEQVYIADCKAYTAATECRYHHEIFFSYVQTNSINLNSSSKIYICDSKHQIQHSDVPEENLEQAGYRDFLKSDNWNTQVIDRKSDLMDSDEARSITITSKIYIVTPANYVSNNIINDMP